ncbi:TetR/AcrR family transcriptional regulator [Pragia fontium]|uniref:TetR/AcrR family transcriptional regulator n=1 Tax=Pragia fontium TaxID=82985 RepID=UPI0006493915|nr:TetR/AcrR family transcriptional regulator [Pragia fontium]AKJ41233.1 hypothetical protein QQ39_03310 [Pragia fontium]
MVRIVKKPDVRRAEILKTAGILFQSQGYEVTSVDEIVRTAGIAKGTFYYYFKSKQDILDALACQLVSVMAESAQKIVDNSALGTIEKFCAVISDMNRVQAQDQMLVDDLHHVENRALHDRNNIEIIRVLGPLMAQVIEQGCQEGVFQVDEPLGTVQFILAGSLFLFGHGIFNWTSEEEATRIQAMLLLIERAVGARSGALTEALSSVLQHRN